MKRLCGSMFATTLALAFIVPAFATEELPPELAMSRLRACVINGSAGAPRDSLQKAVAAVRGLCRPQLDRVRRLSDVQIDAEGAGLSETELSKRRKQAWRKIDFDLALLVSRETGLRQ